MMPRNSSPIIEKEIICTYKIRLERVLGVTVPTNAALANNNNGIVAYPAGCTVILFNARTEQQNHIINISRKTITSLSYSSCGRYIVTGECGHQPAVRVWDLQSDPQSTHPGLAPQPQQVAEFVGHKYGVSCVAFSPNNKYVVSVGTQHDMIVNLWDWRNNVKVASNKVSTKVKAITFAENGSYFVTVGNRHVKFWFLENGKNKYKEAVPLMGRSAILGEQRNNYFCDVACGKGECGDSTYAITRSGLLCEFNNRRLLDKWVELRTTSANCITVGQNYIFVGCAEGIIRCFEPTTLRFITTLPRCHYLGVDVALGTNIRHMATPPQGAKYPDTVAITFDETNNKLTAVYNDHSIYIWDVFNIKRVGKSHSFLYHSACIWGVEMAPPNSPLPPGSFLTCSSDDTVRVWTLDKMTEKNSRGIYQQNIYSKELLKVVYVDKDLSYIKDLDMSRTVNNDKPPDQTSYDGKNGVRCIRVSPDGQHLASGDRTGNIRIHDTSQMKEQCKIEAHDSEVLCLEYSATETHVNLLASASRDRLIHVFDTKHEYNFVQTLDDHSSSITAVRFLNQPQNNVQMISCGADKSLIFRTLKEVNGKAQFVRDQIATGKTTLYDMEVDAGHKHVLTACQDRNVRIYSVNSGKHTKTFKGSPGDDGSLIKVVSDRSGIYMATSCTDKSLSVYDYYSGECMATMCGHGELATGLRFTNDCRRLISASGDGCIFVWRIPHDMVITMQTRLSQQAIRQGKMLDAEMLNESMRYDLHDDIGAVDTNYRFSVGQLPQWAKKQLNEESNQLPSLAKGVAAPKGRWAQRAEASMGVQSFYSSQPLPFPLMDKRFDSDGSKDSSLDSGTEIKHYHEQKNEQIVPKLPPATVNLVRGVMTDDSAIGDVESVAHDGDLDSDSDYRHRPLYYPSLANSPGESEFTVTNIDGEELRKSQRKKKAPQIVIQSGTYDSEDDDDDASTPSGENTDRNPMSLFSVSSESLDQLVNRERYLQATFESMSGADSEPHHSPSNKTSFSSKFLTGGATRNLEAIKAVKQTKSDPEVMKKRQELSKRIAEAKKKLESVGHSSPLRYSQSIHDLSHIPERDKWSKKQVDEVDSNPSTNPEITVSTSSEGCKICTSNQSSSTCAPGVISTSQSVPVDLQLCDCYMNDLGRALGLSYHVETRQPRAPFVNLASLDSESKRFRNSLELATRSPERNLNDFIRPRKLKLDKTLAKYKMHKSLPVSPVSEERQFSDYVVRPEQRQSFSYFLDLDESKSTNEGFKQICNDIEKFSRDFNKKYEQIEQTFAKKDPVPVEEDSNFSSDSLEEYEFFSYERKKSKKSVPPRRCVSNNEIYKYQEDYVIEDIPKSESFYLNQNYSARGSQESILSDDFRPKSSCNSLESVLSNESDCKSAPLEILFEDKRRLLYSEIKLNVPHSQSMSEAELSSSLPKDFVHKPKTNMKTCQTQTDFETPQEIVAKKARGSEDFQRKLLKFESGIMSGKKPVAFFVDTSIGRTSKSIKENVPVKNYKKSCEMFIPSLAQKNKQYKSKFCNVLNNKPDQNFEIFEERGRGNKAFTLSTINFEKKTNNRKNVQGTSSLDRHLFAKGLLNNNEKITHKPPKAVRRNNSSKSRKSKVTTYEYIRKEDFYKTKSANFEKDNGNILNNCTDEHTIELCFKEKNLDLDVEASSSQKSNIKLNLLGENATGYFQVDAQNTILSELYDSLDKKSPPSKMDLDSLDVNLNNKSLENEISKNLFDSLEVNVWNKNSAFQVENVLNKQAKRDEDKIARALQNIKILREIQKKVQKINTLVEIYKENVSKGKVKALSSMYESLTTTPSDCTELTTLQKAPNRFRRRNLSLPSFVERRLNGNNVDECKQLEGKKPSAPARITPRYVKNNSMMRSKSSMVLNHPPSDSENDTQEKKMSRLMRPTISSHNKVNQKPLQARKKQSYSTSNLNQVGMDNVSTSDDEENLKKPQVPPRMSRQQGHENGQTSRYISNKDSKRISNQLCEEVSRQLVASADNVVKIYQKLKEGEEGGDPQPEALDCIKMSLIRTHKVVHDCIFNEFKQNNGNLDVNQTDALKKLNDLVSKGASGSGSVIDLMQQYSDILLDMLQQKIHSSGNI
ncbi:hypothetical protein ABEB36_006606 [Hypothenemus hampei]|uniref:MABP1/WDR62 second WD40 domain-containing protein n=1 Tax=Hypothenemus hampei TaxID=57062 RepID=A0ABD1ER44_HYPHA